MFCYFECKKGFDSVPYNTPLRDGIILENMQTDFHAYSSIAKCGNGSLSGYFPILECVRARSHFKDET